MSPKEESRKPEWKEVKKNAIFIDVGISKKLLKILFFTFYIIITKLYKNKLAALLLIMGNMLTNLFNQGTSKNHIEIEELQQQLGKLRNELAERKAQYKSVWMKAPLYPDWRKEEFKAVNVTLDAGTAHPALLLCEDGNRVTWREPCQDLPHSTRRFDFLPCVLGQLDLRTGRSFWEVEVGNARSCDLGICRNNVTRKGRVTMCPQNGFWAIRLYEGEYWALTSPETTLSIKQTPSKLGIFLDYEAGDVSFYNMTDGSHIFSFPNNTFYGALKPLFRLWSSDPGSLTICPSERIKRTSDVLIDIPNQLSQESITLGPNDDTN